jgi:transcriptional regulator with XRE-family HTH domain
MSKAKNPWPELLKRLRVERGWRQVDAAEEFRVPARSWINWELGLRMPRLRTQRQLREFFKLDLPLSK